VISVSGDFAFLPAGQVFIEEYWNADFAAVIIFCDKKMFTGIIKHVGKVERVIRTGGGLRLCIEIGPLAEGVSHGQSVAVNGACLTAVNITSRTAEFDVMSETLDKSTLGRLSAGARVNLEPALKVSDGLDGHIVQGHVDDIAHVRKIKRGATWDVEFGISREIASQLVTKGSVAVNGVSLTVTFVSADSFGVSLIPTTLGETNLTDLSVGDAVNVETDVIGKYILKYLKNFQQSPQPVDFEQSGKVGHALTIERLISEGF